MPTIPRYEEPQVRQEGFKIAKVSGDAGNTMVENANKLSRSTDKLVDQGIKIADEQKQRADNLAFHMADRQLSEIETSIQTEVKSMRGKDAAKASDIVSKRWEDESSKILNGMANEDQKYKLDVARQQRASSLNKVTQFHMADELNKFADNESAGYLQSSRNAAILNANDNDRIGLELERQKRVIEEWAKRNGVEGTKFEEMKLTEAMSETHLEVIGARLSANQDQAAKKYYEDALARGEIDSRHKAKLDRMVEDGSTRAESLRQSDDLWAKSGGDLKSALDKARKIKDVNIQDATIERLKRRAGEEKSADDMRREKSFIDSLNVLEKTKRIEGSIPDKVWADMTIQERNSLKNYEEMLRAGKKPVTDWQEYYSLYTEASFDRDSFLNKNIHFYRDILADSEFKELVHLQKTLRESGSSKELDTFMTKKQIVDDALDSMKVKQDSKEAIEFRRQVEKIERERIEANPSKKTSAKDIREITDELKVEGITKKRTFWFDEKKKKFQLDEGEAFQDIDVKEIPRSDVEKINEALKKRNIKPSEAAIKQMYLQMRSQRGS
jgi:hypothetical protein